MEANMAGDDASLDAAVAAITKKVMGDDIGAPDKRENRTDRDAIERDDYTDLEALEAAERLGKTEGEEPEQGDTEGEEGQEASAEADAFIELPADEEGKAPERVPIKDAVEAVQKLRQMDGDIATAVIKAEEEAFAKQDQVTQSIANTLRDVEAHARSTLQMLQRFAPQAPHPEDFYTTEDYYKAKLHYESYAEHYKQTFGTMKQAQEGLKVVVTQEQRERDRREIERTNRVIPEFKDEKTREARKSEILDALSKRYGVTKEELDDIIDHKAWRMMNDLERFVRSEKAAPEVRKHLQEKAPKLVKGRLPDREKSTGKFIADARKAHREQGSEDSLARLLLSSGALNGL